MMASTERKNRKHNNRIAEYNLSLPCYVAEIRKLDPIALDGNILAFLEILIERLTTIQQYGRFEEPAEEEIDLNGKNISFTLGCSHCHQLNFTAFELMLHIMNTEHRGKRMRSSSEFRVNAIKSYESFLNEERQILERNGFERPALLNILNFYFITKLFLQLTTRYMNSLRILERLPTTIAARGVLDLLKELRWLMIRAKCVESIPSNVTIHTFKMYRLGYKFENAMFNNGPNALQHARKQFGRDHPLLLPENRNIFSLPSPVISPGVPHAARPFPLLEQIYRQNWSLHQQNIPRVPFSHANHSRGPPIQLPFFPPQGNFQMQFNPSIPPPNFQQLPPVQFNYGNRSSVFNDGILPPLNTSQAEENKIFGSPIKQFLREAKLDHLIDVGNVLMDFGQSSTMSLDLRDALRGVVDNVTVTCFGAKVSGIGYEEDDINLYVNDGKKVKTASSIKLLYKTLMDYFESHGEEWLILKRKEDGVRSNITVKNHCESVSCCISFASEMYCSNTRLIRYFMETFPMCQLLTFYVQEYTKRMEMDLPRYVCVVLVIFWLQIREVLPSVEQLQTDLEEEEWSEDWLINFVPKSRADLKITDDNKNLRMYALEFFLFYSRQFSFFKSVVCPHSGTVINRTDFSPGNEGRLRQRHYRDYLEKMQGKQFAPRFDNTTPMCIQDLLELSSNIAAPVTAKDTEKFVRICSMAYEHLMSNIK